MVYDDLVTLLQATIPDVPIVPGPDVPLNPPGRLVVATPTGGAGLNTDGLLDQPGWQLRCIGDQNNFADAEQLAGAADRAMLRTLRQVLPSGRQLISTSRAGGGPTTLMTDDAGRTHFTCTYLFLTDAGVFQ